MYLIFYKAKYQRGREETDVSCSSYYMLSRRMLFIALIDSLLMLCIICFIKQIQIPSSPMKYSERFCHCHRPSSLLLSPLSLCLSVRFHCVPLPLFLIDTGKLNQFSYICLFSTFKLYFKFFVFHQDFFYVCIKPLDITKPAACR